MVIMSTHDSAGGRRTPPPTSTYRLQLTADFGFDDAARIAPYLAHLGVSHAYLSPVLRATRGSTHGYDVVDHGQISPELGGEAGLLRLADALHRAGLGMVVDVVPNHMGIPVPESDNPVLWSVLREGRDSPYGHWFDIDWAAQRNRVLMPVLGQPLGDVLDADQLSVDRAGDEPVLRYFDHVFPLRAGTEHLPLPELVDAQHYRLAYWRVAVDEPGYRRFFDISTLIAVRVEDPDVFEASHRLLLDLADRGVIDGLRIDHPDGLADPRGYLRRLADASGGRWVVVEKILEGDEQLPPDWPCAGTTGYDAARMLGGVLLDPDGMAALTDSYAELTGAPTDFTAVADAAKLDVLDRVLVAERERLTALAASISAADPMLADHTRPALAACIRALLAACPVYRAYLVPGDPVPPETVKIVEDAAELASTVLPEARHGTLAFVRDAALGRLDRIGDGRDAARDEFVVRFQQTCGPVMAKGREDTAFYRWFPLAATTEVGGDPGHAPVSPDAFHAYCARLAADWPATMTTLSTHDTKRSEDVRARLLTLAEIPDAWRWELERWRRLTVAHREAAPIDPDTEYLLWQTLVGAWPLDAERLTEYLTKAVREAKTHTSWTEPDPAYEDAVQGFARAVLADQRVTDAVAAFVTSLEPYAQANSMSQKLLQLTMPGVPDTYQGTETYAFALVDPDNRRPVDFAYRAGLLHEVDLDPAHATPGDPAKLLLTARMLRLRRAHPEWFGAGAGYLPLHATGRNAAHALAFRRGGALLAVATRLPATLARSGGWGDTTLELGAGGWRDVLTDRRHHGEVALAELTASHPVALLVRDTPATETGGETSRGQNVRA
jgi:(1->4)-alpha-D-glucan 1-alpha-D-glucosylmutase